MQLQEAEPVLEIVSVGLDGVGGALDQGQVGKPALDRLHRRVVVTQHRPGLYARVGHPHPLYAHAASRSLRGGRRKITASTTCPKAAPHLVIYVPEASTRTLDNHRPRARSSPHNRPRRRAARRPEGASGERLASLERSSTQRSATSAESGIGATPTGSISPTRNRA